MRLVTPLEMMKLEDLTNQSGVSYDSMMDQAGSGLAVHIARAALEQGKNSIVFLCGNGNNAGDCFVAAAKLAKQFNVTVCMTAGSPKTRTAYTKYRQLKTVPLSMHRIRSARRCAMHPSSWTVYSASASAGSFRRLSRSYVKSSMA